MAVEVHKIDAQTWRLENGFVRFFLLAGDREAVLLDSGVDCPDAGALAESLTNLPVRLMNTHADPDHISGNGGFGEVSIFREDYEAYALAEKHPGCRCLPLTDGMIVDLGNRPLEILHIPGHTPGSLAVLDKSRRALYSGDTIQDGNIFLFGPTRRPDLLAASLEKLMSRAADFDCVYPCHGTPVLRSDSPAKVLADWQQVCAGKLTGKKISLFGNPVTEYRGKFCGFYCGCKPE